MRNRVLGAVLLASLALPARAEAAPASAGEGFAAFDAQDRAAAELWSRLPYTARHAMFVTRKAAAFGDYEARPSNVFAPGETLLSYMEPIGYAYRAVGAEATQFGVTVDFEVLSTDGRILGGQKNLLSQDVTSRYRNREFFLNLTMSLDGAPPGDYVLAYTLRDNVSGRTTRIEQPFTIRG